MARLLELSLFAPCLVLFAGLCLAFPELTNGVGRFLPFFAAFLLLPGYLLAGLLVRGSLSLFERLAFGYPVALGLMYVLSFLGGRLGLPWLPWIILPISALLVLCLRRWYTCDAGGYLSVGDFALCFIVTLISLGLCLSKLFTPQIPLSGLPVTIYNDDVGVAAYVWAAAKAMDGGEVLSSLTAGFPLSYHLLYHYCCAAAFRIVGAVPIEQVLYHWPPMHWTLTASGFVLGCRRLGGMSPGETAMAALLVFFSAGPGFYGDPGIQVFNYFHTYFFGLLPFFLFLTGLYGYLGGRRERLDWAYLSVLFLVASGTKGVLLLMLPLSLFPVLLFRGVRRMIRRDDILLVLGCLLVVAVLHFAMFQDSERVAMRIPRVGDLLLGVVERIGQMALVAGAYLALYAFAADNDVAIARKMFRDQQYLLFAATFAVVSAVLLKWFNFIGGDNYFYWYARNIILLCIGPVFWHLLRWRKGAFAAAALALILLGVGLFLRARFVPLPGVPSEAINGVPQVAAGHNIDREEWDGLAWASHNLDQRRTIISNKNMYMGSYRGGFVKMEYYHYLGLSGMQGYAWYAPWLSARQKGENERRLAAQDAFFAAVTAEQWGQALGVLEVDYLFQCLRTDPRDLSDTPGLRKIFGNRSLIIYEVTGRRM